MPQTTTYRWATDAAGKPVQVSETTGRKLDEDTLAAGEAKKTFSASKVKADVFVPPKMESGESSSAYGERVRKARLAFDQKRAMSAK